MQAVTRAGRRLRIAYIGGPVDAVAIHRQWVEAAASDYFGTDYMRQFLQLVSDLGAQAHIVTWHAGPAGVTQLGDFTFDNRPIPGATGLGYHLANIFWFLRLAPRLARFRADVLILIGNANYWWVLSFLGWFGAAFIPSYHGVLWNKFGHVAASWRLMLKLNRRLILKPARAIVAASDDIRRQAEELLGKDAAGKDIVTHLPSYSRVQFAPIPAPGPPPRRPFRTILLGRTVANKGIFDVVEIARRLEQERKGEFVFDICGDGVDFGALQARVSELGLEQAVILHGYCRPDAIRRLYGQSHAAIVPTRTEIEVGFEMTCAEAILAGRPLITSPVCPALEYVREASVAVEPNDADQYREAIVRLADDEAFYQEKRAACGPLQDQFYDPANSWYAAMRLVIERHVLQPAPQPAELAPTV